MTGFSGSGNNGSTISNPQGNPVIDSVALSNVTGATAQSWNGVYMVENNWSLVNLNTVNGNKQPPNPQDKTPGYLAAGQPTGLSLIVPDTDAANANGGSVLDIYPPAGFLSGVSNSQTDKSQPYQSGRLTGSSYGWTVQGSLEINADDASLSIVVNPEYAVNVTSVAGTVTPAISGGTSPYSVALVEYNGTSTSAFPTLGAGSLTLASATGVLTVAIGTTAGTYNLAFRVTDTSSPANVSTFAYQLVVTG